MTFLLNRIITVYHFVRKTERGNEKRFTLPSPPPLPAAVIESLKSKIEIDGRIESIKKKTAGRTGWTAGEGKVGGAHRRASGGGTIVPHRRPTSSHKNDLIKKLILNVNIQFFSGMAAVVEGRGQPPGFAELYAAVTRRWTRQEKC